MDTESLVKRVLEEHFHFEVEKIPESNKKTPDFLVLDGTNEYLVEVKEKGSNPETIRTRRDAFSKGEIFRLSESLATKSVLQNVVRDGRKQIDSYATNQSTFRIVWIHCRGLAYDATLEQIITGLYGSETIIHNDVDSIHSRLCYYFSFSQFYKYRDTIDAVMITGQNGEAVLCVNNHSPRYEQLKKSELVNAMSVGVRDPINEEIEGRAFLVDGAVDRDNPSEVLFFLSKKYNIDRPSVMNMTHMEVHMAIPHKKK